MPLLVWCSRDPPELAVRRCAQALRMPAQAISTFVTLFMCAFWRQSTHLFFFQVFREGVDPSKLQDEDLGARFAYYAKRLTRVVLGLPDSRKRTHSKTVAVDSAVLAVWSQMEHLFPRLRTVVVDGSYLIDPDYACVGFGSFLRFRGLRTLQISAPGCLLEAAAEFRNGIVDACSRITALTLAMHQQTCGASDVTVSDAQTAI
jgi:hypothetical protein